MLLTSIIIQPLLVRHALSELAAAPKYFDTFAEIITIDEKHMKKRLTVSTASSLLSRFACPFATFSMSNLLKGMRGVETNGKACQPSEQVINGKIY